MNQQSLLIRIAVLVAAVMCTLGARAQEAYAWYSPGSNSLTFCYDNASSNPATDCNQDGTVNINDTTALIDYLLNGEW